MMIRELSTVKLTIFPFVINEYLVERDTLCLLNMELIFKWDYLEKYMLIKSIGGTVGQKKRVVWSLKLIFQAYRLFTCF